MEIKKLKNKKIMILGLGVSGFETALVLEKLKTNITIIDNNLNSKYYNYLKKSDFNIISQETAVKDEKKYDIIIKSPGIPFDNEVLQKYSESLIINDIELSYQYIKEQKLPIKIIAITGTNGKTTTVSFLEHTLRMSGFKVQSAGNIGVSPLSILNIMKDLDYLILELSSFQLKNIDKFHPNSAFITNITPDHLNIHKTFEDYLQSKKQIFKNQTKKDHLYVQKNVYQKYLKNEKIDVAITQSSFLKEAKRKLENVNIGPLILENLILCYEFIKNEKIDENIFFKSIENFPNLEHRIEFVRTLNNVNYYNDSKATNLEATSEALKKLKNIILIVGGKSKGEDLNKFGGLLKNVKYVITYGENSSEFKTLKLYKKVRTLDEALICAQQVSQKNDNVLLSPASASFDQYENYVHRGNVFKKLVNEMR